MNAQGVPVDDALRHRLVTRYGAGVELWLDALPSVLDDVARRWQLQLDALIPRGTMSAVVRCVTADGQRAVLKVCPDRDRLAHEADALGKWTTDHVPAVLAVDTDIGALLIEAIEPGTMVADLATYPTDAIAELMRALHTTGVVDRSYLSLHGRIAHLFDAWARHRALHPHLRDVVSPELFARGRAQAERLAGEPAPTVLLHGDLTPVNVLDGGHRGLVAIDPAPCPGDPAFDAIDLLFWQANDVATITGRANALGPAIGSAPSRLLDWCAAFGAMVASELAENFGPHDPRVEAALTLTRSR